MSNNAEKVKNKIMMSLSQSPDPEPNRFKYVAFIDLMAFKNLIDKEFKACKYDYPVYAFLKTLHETIFEQLKFDIQNNEYQYLMISDSIYFFFNKKSIEKILELVGYVFFCGYFAGFTYRGFIANTHVLNDPQNSGLYIGKGIVDAYVNESKTPIYSRLLVSKETALDLKEHVVFSTIDKLPMIDIFGLINKNFIRYCMQIKSNNMICNLIDKCEYDCILKKLKFKELTLDKSYDYLSFKSSMNEFLDIQLKKYENDLKIYQKYILLEKEFKNYGK